MPLRATDYRCRPQSCIAAGWAHDGMSAVESRENSFGDMWVLSSSDNGRSWGAPKNITSQVWSKPQHLPALNNGHGTQTSTGRLIMPACARPDAMVPAQHMQEHSAIIYSDDHGLNWEFAPHSLVGVGTTESEVVELQHSTGTLMFNHRSLNVCPAYPENRTKGPPYHICRWASYSSDMGLTWHGFEPLPQLPDPGCKGGTCAWPRQKALLFTNNAESIVGARVNITLRASFDDGRTWPTHIPIGPRLAAVPNATNSLKGPGGYSDVVMHEYEGKEWAAVVYEFSDPFGCSIKLAVADPDLLLPRD